MRKFINKNILLSNSFEKKFFSFNKRDTILLFKFFKKYVKEDSKIADIGGGKKPIKSLYEQTNIPNKIVYDGYDISKKEFEIARNKYTNIYELDLNQTNNKFAKKYDLILCNNTLEHLNNVSKGIKNLTLMVKNKGRIYIKMPCKYSIYSQLNLILPNKFKNKIMHWIFPSKKGDGFPAFYDKATPIEIINIFRKEGFFLEEYNYVKWSSYFTFLFPLYFVWRIITIVQNLIIKDYCESFEMIFYKNQ